MSETSDATLFILFIHMSVKEGEAISFVATASKLAAVEDAAPKGPEASIRSKVSPTARAALQALRTPRNRISSPLTPSPPITKDVETITGKFFSFILYSLYIYTYITRNIYSVYIRYTYIYIYIHTIHIYTLYVYI